MPTRLLAATLALALVLAHAAPVAAQDARPPAAHVAGGAGLLGLSALAWVLAGMGGGALAIRGEPVRAGEYAALGTLGAIGVTALVAGVLEIVAGARGGRARTARTWAPVLRF